MSYCERGKMTTNLSKKDSLHSIESVLIQGDLSQLSQGDRLRYYSRLCESLALNPLTQPQELRS